MQMDNYEDIINLPHHTSKKHPRMSLEARSVQFAPFAALTGYDDIIKETGRYGDSKIELDETQKIILDGKLQILHEEIKNRPIITFTHFVKDRKKDGGTYEEITGVVKKIDEHTQEIILEDKSRISIGNIIRIESTSKIFGYYDEENG